MARYRQQAAIAAVIVGLAVAIVGAALMVSVWTGVQFVRSNQLHDTYFVMPGAWMLLIFGVGVVGDIAFWRQAAKFGRRAMLIWQTHLLITTVLVITALVAATRADMTWAVMLLLLATTPLMLVAHGAALTAGGVVVLRASKQP